MRANSSSVGIASFACLVVLAVATPALASDEDVDLKARTHFAAGEYAQALDIYAQLYAETLHPTYLRNIGRCHQNLGNADKAISSFREYLRKARDLPASQRAEIEAYIAEMEQLKRSQAAGPVLAAPRPAVEAPPALVAAPPTVTAQASTTGSENRPFYTRVWFWVAVTAVAAAGVTGVLLLGADRSPTHGNVGVIDLRSKDTTP